MTAYKKNKIVVIGAGNVGEAISYTLMLRKQARDIVLVDLNEERAMGSALDISHGTAFFRQTQIRKGGYEECADAKIIIITAGISRKPGQTRLELAQTNVSIARSITQKIMEYAKDPILVVVSNPVDILTMAVLQESGLSASQVIGTGTSLDTARFRSLLSDVCKVDVCDINAYILGEHGDSQVPIWSRATVGGENIEDFLENSRIDLDKEMIAHKAKDAGAEIISLKGATFYGIAMTTSRIVEAISGNENAILPVAHVLDRQFGDWQGVAISLPCVLNSRGVSRAISLPLNEQEKQAMDQSARTLREFWDKVTDEKRGESIA